MFGFEKDYQYFSILGYETTLLHLSSSRRQQPKVCIWRGESPALGKIVLLKAEEMLKYLGGGRKTRACRVLMGPKCYMRSCEGLWTFRGVYLQVKVLLLQRARMLACLTPIFTAHQAISSPCLSHVLWPPYSQTQN